MKALLPREIECLHWIAKGKKAVEIAIILSIELHTVQYYLRNMRLKLGCCTVAQAVYVGIKSGLIY